MSGLTPKYVQWKLRSVANCDQNGQISIWALHSPFQQISELLKVKYILYQKVLLAAQSLTNPRVSNPQAA